MSETQKYGIEIPAASFRDYQELADKVYPVIKTDLRGNFTNWGDKSDPWTNSTTGNFMFLFPVQWSLTKIKSFLGRVGLSSSLLTYARANLEKADTTDRTDNE